MSTPTPEDFPEFLSDAEFSQLMHDRLLAILQDAQEKDHHLLDIEVDEEMGQVTTIFHITGRQDSEPLLLTDRSGNLKYLVAEIYMSEEFGDITALGRDAEGDPTVIMQLDNMAELKSRSIQVLVNTYDSPGWEWDYQEDRPLGHEKGWMVTYDIDGTWAIRFWKDYQDPNVSLEPVPYSLPEDEDLEQLVLAIDQADKVIDTPE